VNEPLAIGDVALHLVDVDLADGFAPGRTVHVDVHDVLGDGLCTSEGGTS
jgi:hypothetical protein